MQSSIPPGAKPASAFDVISQRLAAINVFSPRPGASDAELVARAGTVCATTAANIVAQISRDKRLDRKAKTKAGGEALAFALMADLLMGHAASLGAPVATEGGKE